MIAASRPIQRPADAKLLVAHRGGQIRHQARSDIVCLFQVGDLVIANDAATLPASLSGIHIPSGRLVEARLAGRCSLVTNDVRSFFAVLFG